MTLRGLICNIFWIHLMIEMSIFFVDVKSWNRPKKVERSNTEMTDLSLKHRKGLYFEERMILESKNTSKSSVTIEA